MKPFYITHTIEVRDGAPFFLIGGPCVIESMDHVDFLCGRINEICSETAMPKEPGWAGCSLRRARPTEVSGLGDAWTVAPYSFMNCRRCSFQSCTARTQ